MIAPLRYAEQQPNPTSLIEANMPFVQRLAWHFYGRVGRYVEIDDLLQAGYLGLIGAAQRYSPCDGVSFSTYAAIRIRGSIIDFLRSNSNLCRNTITMRKKVDQASRELSQVLGREPEKSELAEKLGLTQEELHEWENRFQANQVQSLDEIYTDHSILFSDTKGTSEDDLERSQLKEILKQSLTELPERSALVLQLYYVEELNVYEIAAILEVSTGRVSQIKKAAIEQLRDIIQGRLVD
jgi:RNA polymerase sigma factor for flagellar operon FliA